ncbi:hypothetical protein CVIRNUC_007255 [Coccomyxa viridis]|uniref:Phosphatidate cytidylyltransferase, mitochondrial n=1 Tax=Coccomyxa viridis TaxID=1274662 RepID=A0AAV1IAC9_9CHLO|nr:hypothetical protein CVIRNUC_007255 [Coccomyxa viridis]
MTHLTGNILRTLPRARSVFAYGSAAFQQPGLYDATKTVQQTPMLDIIIAADNPVAWHHENMATNGHHYSVIRCLGPSLMCALCESIGRGVHFNPYASIGRQAIKYGVVSTSALLRDLWSWDSFYVAGRLHKPVLFLVRDAAVDRAVAANIDAALAAALLLLPARFTAKALMEAICGLSYAGDIRMRWGEDARKVQRIVEGSWAPLAQMFLPPMQGEVGQAAGLWPVNAGGALCDLRQASQLEQSMTPEHTERLLSFLPGDLRDHVEGQASAEKSSKPDVLRWRTAIAASMSAKLALIIRASSIRQALWGVASAGPHRAWQYALAKARKGFKA